MAELIYLLCALTSFASALLLLRAYRRTRTPLLLWSSLCFGFFVLNNVGLVVDMMVIQSIDLYIPRTLTLLAGFVVLLYGLIWERGTR